MKVTAKMLIAVGLLFAAVCVADGDKMLAKDGTPLPDGVARIVKWEASQFRQHKAYACPLTDSEIRKAAHLPHDATQYYVGAGEAGYVVVVSLLPAKTAYVYHFASWHQDGVPVIIIE